MAKIIYYDHLQHDNHTERNLSAAYELGYNCTIDSNFGYSRTMIDIDRIVAGWDDEFQEAYQMGVEDAKGDLC